MVDSDIERLTASIGLPLNFEMAATGEMLAIALRHKPHAACLVPERREERTTEGGLDAVGGHNHLAPIIAKLRDAGIRVSLFIAPDKRQLDMAARLGAPVVELHTGPYCHAAPGPERAAEVLRLAEAAAHGHALGLEIHAGHGLDFETVGAVAALPELAELNIGHALIGEAIFVGLGPAIRRMRDAMTAARA
jgi:pyridoxine 5-phosphate synthase